MDRSNLQQRYYTTYSGIKLPFKLLNELDNDSLDNRNTYFVGYYDAMGKLMSVEKVVYGEIEFSHQYEYNKESDITRAIILEEGEVPRTLVFDQNGNMSEI